MILFLVQVLFLVNNLQGFLEKFPEWGHGVDEATLRGGVRAAECWSERYHIHAWIFAEYDGALQSGMVYLYQSLLAVLLLVDCLQQVQYGAVRVGSQPP